MSFSYLKIIPNDPTYVPDQLSQDKAKNFLSDIYKGVIKLEATENIEFIDQGDGFESVSCNKCGKEIDIEYWQEAMNSSYEQHFKNLSFIAPCCGNQSSLNDLNYKAPAGFAKFVIRIRDAYEDLAEKELQLLEEVLGTELRIVWAHY